MPKYPAMRVAKGSLLHNDDSHNFADPQGGGSPLPRGSNPPAHARGAFGARGQASRGVPRGRTRPGTGNPADRPGFRGEARGGAFQPEDRTGRGGSPQHRERNPGAPAHGGFGAYGKEDAVNQYPNANPQPGSGNAGGRSYRLIAGRFKRAAMGARPTADSGKYGSAPVRANT